VPQENVKRDVPFAGDSRHQTVQDRREHAKILPASGRSVFVALDASSVFAIAGPPL